MLLGIVDEGKRQGSLGAGIDREGRSWVDISVFSCQYSMSDFNVCGKRSQGKKWSSRVLANGTGVSRLPNL